MQNGFCPLDGLYNRSRHIMGCGLDGIEDMDASVRFNSTVKYMDFHENMSFCVRDAFGYKKQYINVS